jgi:hypothetical protein
MTARDIRILRRAIKQADKSHMRQEFKDFYRSLKNHQYEDSEPLTVYTKCWMALYEWDLLDIHVNTGYTTLDF